MNFKTFIKTVKGLFLILIIQVFVLFIAHGAGAVTINVNAPGGGGCDDVVDAIDSANMDMSVGGCTAGSGSDIIELAASSTYTLTAVDNDTNGFGNNGFPVITTVITVNGNGATIERQIDLSGTPCNTTMPPRFRFF